MPAKHASPKKLRVPEWYVSSFMDRALDAVVRQIVKARRRHDIPYLAGYSRDGKTIYIDRHMPKWFTFQARRINTDRFLILHEAVEKALIDHLGLRYLHAHQIATRAEQAAVRGFGINLAGPMTALCGNLSKESEMKPLSRVPRDLDLKPDVDPDEVSALQSNDDEDIEQVEVNGRGNEQVHGGRRMITQEGAPCRRGRFASLDRILRDAGLSVAASPCCAACKSRGSIVTISIVRDCAGTKITVEMRR